MEWALRHALQTRPGARRPLTVLVSVPQGAALAEHTFNSRLGIVGGISILGTQGTVRPFSHAAWKATIAQGLEVVRATGCPAVGLSAGRRSERLLMARHPHLPALAFVQVADFAAFSLKAAGALPNIQIIWGCFFGKLLKLAQGHAYTHARSADLDLEILQDTYISINSVGKDIFGGYYNGQATMTGDTNLFEVAGNFVAYCENNNQEGCQQVLAQLESVQQSVLTQVARIGGLENRVSTASDVLSFQKLDQEERLSYIEDIDLTELLSKLTRQQLTYQTVLQSSSLIMQMSLANYL
jgi:flagellin-like hook-associated protein FlgL